MVMTTVDDETLQVGLMLENQSRGVSNSDNLVKNKGKYLEMMKTMDQKEGNEGEAALVNKKRKGTVSRSEKTVVANGEEGKSEHEMHIWTERERRKKMRNMFSSLQALLPNVSSKADKSTIVDEAVSYIQKLQQSLEKLEKQKQDRLQCVSPLACESSVTSSQWQPYDSKDSFIADHQGFSNSNLSNVVEPSKAPLAFQTWTSANLVLNICEDVAQFCICSTKKPGLMTTIAFVLEKHRIDVISASISRKHDGKIYMIQAHAKRGSHQFQDANSVGETYLQAAGEISLWINVA